MPPASTSLRSESSFNNAVKQALSTFIPAASNWAIMASIAAVGRLAPLGIDAPAGMVSSSGKTKPVVGVESLVAPEAVVALDFASLPQPASSPRAAIDASSPVMIGFMMVPFEEGTSVPDHATGMGSATTALLRDRRAASAVAMTKPSHTRAKPTTRDAGSASWNTSQPRQKLMVGTM